MKRLLLATTAIVAFASVGAAGAADLPLKAPPMVAAPVYNWSGCYLGADVGYAQGRDSNVEVTRTTGALSPFTPATNAEPNGGKFGGFVGCNWQFSGPVVFGVEGDGEWARLRGTADYTNTQIPPDFYESRINGEGSVRGRVGLAYERALFYVTGGVAFAGITEHYVGNGTPVPVINDISSTRIGWTAGGGLDYMITANWIGRVEYRYADFGTLTTNPTVFPAFTENHKITENVIRLGLAYKFGWAGPVVAKY